MSDRPRGHAERATSGPGLVPALERVLAEVRAHAPEYRRWWVGEHAAGSRPAPTPPWSEEDEERAARLGSLDPWWMRSVAGELERAHTVLGDIGAELARMAHSAIGGAAAARCALLAASSHERASEAAALASGARTEGERADELLNTVARRLTDVVDVRASAESPWREPPTRELPWREPSWLRGPSPHSDGDGAGAAPGDGADGCLGGCFDGYAAVLRAVRAELSAAIEQLPSLAGLHRAQLSGWTSEPGPGGWTPEPGTGPQLPGTEARRVETDTGVRIARLPDGPAG